MSTTTTQPIPSEDDVQVSTGRQSWRCANGKICQGSEESGTLVIREKLVGALRRIGIHEGSYDKDGKTKRVYQLEADIETAQGMERVKASLCNLKGENQASGVAVGLAWGLLQIAKDEVMILTTAQGTKKNEYGSYSTFVNVFRLPEGSSRGVEVPRRGKSDEPLNDTMAKLLSEIRTHPAFAERPASEKDEDGKATTHLSALCQECAAKGWPTPEQAPTEWLTANAKAFRHEPRASLSAYSDDEWGDVRLTLQDKKDCPAFLKDAKARLASASDEYKDPFA